jgi:hypothetical protein
VTAEALYEAAVLALAEFRRFGFTDARTGSATRLNIAVLAPSTSHEVSVRKVHSWLEGSGGARTRHTFNVRLREVLGRAMSGAGALILSRMTTAMDRLAQFTITPFMTTIAATARPTSSLPTIHPKSAGSNPLSTHHWLTIKRSLGGYAAVSSHTFLAIRADPGIRAARRCLRRSGCEAFEDLHQLPW